MIAEEQFRNSKTIRQSIIEELLAGMKTVRELSQTLRISEKEVLSHFPHIKKSAEQKNYKFVMKPSECRNCGFIFESRHKWKKPSRCPNCKRQYLTNPLFGLMSNSNH